MSRPTTADRIVRVRSHLDRLGISAGAGRGRPAALAEAVPGGLRPVDLARRIEHTRLGADARPSQIAVLCDEARRHGFRGVCVNPIFVEEAKRRLAGSDGRVVTVVGFPLGASLTATKAAETKAVLELGADEIDMVIAVGLLKEGQHRRVFDDIATVVAAAGDAPVKVILETALLEEEEKIAGCLLAERAGASYVKTSTGFAAAGATPADVTLLRAVVGPRLGVKASGGIRDLPTARAMIEAGADVLGTSSSVRIVSGDPSPAA